VEQRPLHWSERAKMHRTPSSPAQQSGPAELQALSGPARSPRFGGRPPRRSISRGALWGILAGVVCVAAAVTAAFVWWPEGRDSAPSDAQAVAANDATAVASPGAGGSTAGVPPACSGHVMVYAPATGKVILVGGSSGGFVDRKMPIDTWAYDVAANIWTNLDPDGEVPEARFDHAMAYDATLGKMILFGGATPYRTGLDDTWAYDPAANTWTELEPSGQLPRSREGHSLVSDPASGKLILFGGTVSSTYEQEGGQPDEYETLGDTWAYDPETNTWTELQPTGETPVPRTGHAMVYDPATGKMILFGGFGGDMFGDVPLEDTWAYDPAANTWTRLAPAGAVPQRRGGHNMIYDSSSGRLLLFGGAGDYGSQYPFDDIWAYEPMANSWTEISLSGGKPSARAYHAMAYDVASKRVVLFGGGTYSDPLGDTWTYDPAANAWTDCRPVADLPAARQYHSLLYERSSARVILSGGMGERGWLDDTWAYDPITNTWTEQSGDSGFGSGPPLGGLGASAAYDPDTGNVFACGGDFTVTAVYTSAANEWTAIPTSGDLPDARFAHSVVYDPVGRKVILLGGWADEEECDNRNPWAYDPATNTWTELRPSGDLPPDLLLSPLLVYDPVGRKVLLLSAIVDSMLEEWLPAIWAYDPAANIWTRLDPEGESPALHEGMAAVYDPIGKKVILFGGMSTSGTLNDTWAYDPAADAWTRLTPGGKIPPGRVGHAMAYDTAGGKIILFGGHTLSISADGQSLLEEAWLNDTWAYDPAANTWTNLAPVGTATHGVGAPQTETAGSPPHLPTGVSAEDHLAQGLLSQACADIEGAHQTMGTFDSTVITPAVLADIAPEILWMVGADSSVATAPTASAPRIAVSYFGTATMYAVGTVSESGRSFGIVADRSMPPPDPNGWGHGRTYYVDGVAVGENWGK